MDRVILDIDQIGKRQDKIWGNYPPNGNLPGSQYRVKPLSIVSTELPGVLNFVIKIDTHANQDHQNSRQKNPAPQEEHEKNKETVHNVPQQGDWMKLLLESATLQAQGNMNMKMMWLMMSY